MVWGFPESKKVLGNYKISDFTTMLKAGSCQFAGCDVEPTLLNDKAVY